MDFSKAAPPDDRRRFLRRSDAAVYITERYGFPCSRQWLAKLAVGGGGPTFRKAGRYPIYDPADLDLWAERRPNPRIAKVHRSYSVEEMRDCSAYIKTRFATG